MIAITTSNLNGIRAASKKGMLDWSDSHASDVWCMQEVRAPQDAIDAIMSKIKIGYIESENNEIKENSNENDDFTYVNEVCKVKGRAGVALVTSLPVVAKRYGLPGLSEDVDSGRWIETDVLTPQGYEITVASVYVHAGNVDDDEKMHQKFRFLDTMLTRLGELRDIAASGGNQAILCGDFNIAHTALDIKNAKANEKNAGFLPEERAYIDRWINEYEFVDVMRMLAGDIQGPYTWWSQRGKAFDNNVGWRLDYQFATPELAETACGFVIDRAQSYDTRWSDHAPLTIRYNL